MNYRWTSRFLLGAFLLSRALAGQACELLTPPTWTLDGYDPASAAASARALPVRIHAPKGCLVALQAEWQGVGGELLLYGAGIEPLRLMLSTDAAASVPVPGAPQDIGTYRVEAGRDTQVYLWATAAAGQWVSPGNYSSQLRLRLVSGAATVSEREIAVSVRVKAAVRATFAGGAGKLARLDFGELQQGARRDAQLEVQANTGHRLTLESSNRGKLVNRRFRQSTVPYRLRVAGVAVSPEASGAGIDIAAAGRARHRIDVEIGEVDRVLAGDYADDLLITITAQ